MAEKQKACPQCGSEMSYRLGMYECPQCGHEEEDKAATAPEAQTSGPGFRREQWQRTPPAPGRPPPGPGQVPPPTAMGTLYTPGAAPPAGMYGQPASGGYDPYPSLKIEKIIYFSLQVLGWLVIVVSLAVISSMSGAVPELGVSIGAIGAGLVIGGLAELGLSWFVLFGDQIWAKYCCGGCVAVTILLMLPGMFIAAPGAAGLPLSRGIDVVSGIIQILVDLWLLSILWRDIQRLQGR